MPAQDDLASACLALRHNLHLENTTILNATYISEPANVPTPGSCQTYAYVSDPLCRVQFVVNTTLTSSVYAEAWLPDVWYGHSLGLGNGGVGGCIYYSDMQYTSNLHFAVVALDNGHDGYTGEYFLNNPEAVIEKQIVQAYYGQSHDKSYFLGCSTGGRQGTQAALMFPGDFDGIVAGSPATDWNHLLGWGGMMQRYVGAPDPSTSATFIPPHLWNVIADEVLNQCDMLDGVKDGIITEPDDCHFRPDVIRCTRTRTTNCLSDAQVGVLRKIYRPLYDPAGRLLYPQYDPGTEADGNAQSTFSGSITGPTADWYRNTILNDTSYDFSDFGLRHIALADRINPGGVSTSSGNLSAFMKRGGKFVTYHGRRDPAIPLGSSKRMYNLIAKTLRLTSLDSFYRLFLIPGRISLEGPRVRGWVHDRAMR
ncbi:Tannase/feruloyl esterase [Crassisporium funariophilum]|nr:Tannase/feruloyl esterase [Crassisporium funariophilum]